MSQDLILNAALDALASGWPVMPVSRQKVPLIKWKEFQTTLPTEAQIREWFTAHRNRNLGLITGALSGRFVVESDSQDALDYIISKGVPLGPVAQSSQPYKRHFHFRHPGFAVKNSASELFEGVDVRGDGGYAVLPPSVHKSGAVYQWLTSPYEAPLPDVPDWILEAVKRPVFEPGEIVVPKLDLNGSADAMRRYAGAALEAELSLVAHAPDGQKHAQLFKSVAACAEFIPHGLLGEEEIRAAFFAVVEGRAENKKGALDTIRDALKRGTGQPRRLPERSEARPAIIKGRKRASAFIAGTDPDAEDEDEPPDTGDEDERQINEGLYGIQNGRTVLMVSKEKSDANGSSDVTAKHFVCDFAAHIVAETRTEDGTARYEIEGVTIERTAFAVEIPAGEISDARKVAFRLANVKGAGIKLYAGMEKHLGPSIETFTRFDHLRHTQVYERTGWTKDGKQFIIPGMESDGMKINLDRSLAYHVTPCKDGVAADLELLLSAHLDTITPITLMHSLFAPMSRKANLQDEKFATFVVGRSGTLKTSYMQMGLCIYGDFGSDDKLLKLGAGGTVNSMMDYPAKAADLPLLFDNFKPGTGSGQKDATTLVHGLMEGTERKRLNRDGSQRVAKELRCFLQFTGEDTIHDAASVARMLILAARDPGEACIENLTRLQARAHELPRIGGAWLSWLQSDEAAPIIRREAARLGELRGKWVAFLRRLSKEMVNAMRVATSLACLEITYACAIHCPAFKAVLHWWKDRFDAALAKCAADMTGYSMASHEGPRFLATLRALLISQRAYLQDSARDPEKDERRAFVGWQTDVRVYLLPDAAFSAVSDALRSQPHGLNGLAASSISKQLDGLGLLIQRDGANLAVKKKVGVETGKVRVWVLDRAAFFDDPDDPETEENHSSVPT